MNRRISIGISAMVVVVAGTVLSAAGAAPAGQPAGQAAAQASVTLKPALKAGVELRYSVRIERKDMNYIPKNRVQMSPPPAADNSAPGAGGGEAPKSDPGVTDSAPDRTKDENTKPTATPPAPPSTPAPPRVGARQGRGRG